MYRIVCARIWTWLVEPLGPSCPWTTRPTLTCSDRSTCWRPCLSSPSGLPGENLHSYIRCLQPKTSLTFYNVIHWYTVECSPQLTEMPYWNQQTKNIFCTELEQIPSVWISSRKTWWKRDCLARFCATFGYFQKTSPPICPLSDVKLSMKMDAY